jgi:hypothetical protein
MPTRNIKSNIKTANAQADFLVSTILNASFVDLCPFCLIEYSIACRPHEVQCYIVDRVWDKLMLIGRDNHYITRNEADLLIEDHTPLASDESCKHPSVVPLFEVVD